MTGGAPLAGRGCEVAYPVTGRHSTWFLCEGLLHAWEQLNKGRPAVPLTQSEAVVCSQRRSLLLERFRGCFLEREQA